MTGSALSTCLEIKMRFPQRQHEHNSELPAKMGIA
jgi:hypothetical protein